MTSNVTEGELWKIKWNVTFPGADNIESVIITYKEVTTTMLLMKNDGAFFNFCGTLRENPNFVTNILAINCSQY